MKLTTLKDQVIAFVREEEGATAIEYALIAALIALAIVGALQATGTSLNGLFERVQDTLDGPSSS